MMTESMLDRITPDGTDATDATVVDVVLVPLDGSTPAQAALGPALALARRFGAELKVVMTTFSGDPCNEHRYLERQAGALDYAPVSAEVVRCRFPARGIAECVESSTVVCMATDGSIGAGRLMLGSVAQQIATFTNLPMVLVGPGCRPVDQLIGPVVVGWDGTCASAWIIPTAAAWAALLDLELRLLSVRDPGQDRAATVWHAHGADGVAEDRSAMVRRAVDRLRVGGAHADGAVIDDRHPAVAIVAVAHATSASLVVVAGGASPGRACTFGRVTSDIVHRSPCPVLVAPRQGVT